MSSRPVLLAVCCALTACSDDGAGFHDDGDGPPPCGVSSGSAFRVEIYSGVVFPYKPDTEAPWDWDGDVPDWMIDVTNALAAIAASPEVKAAAEIMELVDQYGPILLEGTVPPDPILYAFAALNEATLTTTSTIFGGTTYTTTYGTYTFGTLDSRDDTYEPVFNRSVDVDLYNDESLFFQVIDEDLQFDDQVGTFWLGLPELREMAKCGPMTIRAPGTGLYSLDILVEPL